MFSVKGLRPYRHASQALDRAIQLCSVIIKTLIQASAMQQNLTYTFP